MSTSTGHQPAQIGISTVLLSVIMLFIGVSVSWRIIQQVRQETMRTESTQAFNESERIVSIEGNTTTKRRDLTTQQAVSYLNPTEDILFVKKAETISIKVDSENNGFLDHSKLPAIYFGYGEPTSTKPRLLVRRIRTNPTNGRAEVVQEYYCPDTCSTVAGSYIPITNNCSGSSTGLCANGFKYRIDNPLSSYSIADGDVIVIMVLANDTYVGMKGLARHYRAASYTGDNEVRVIEQSETDPSAPGMFQFSILVNGSITN